MFKTLVFLFVWLSCMDFFCTLYLIKTYNSNIEENPIASIIYDRFNVAGLCLYKCLMVLTVLWIISYINAKNRYYPLMILGFGNIVLIFIVFYSLLLMI